MRAFAEDKCVAVKAKRSCSRRAETPGKHHVALPQPSFYYTRLYPHPEVVQVEHRRRFADRLPYDPAPTWLDLPTHVRSVKFPNFPHHREPRASLSDKLTQPMRVLTL
jgi:hypothetical protein